jgi:hypothetical protein
MVVLVDYLGGGTSAWKNNRIHNHIQLQGNATDFGDMNRSEQNIAVHVQVKYSRSMLQEEQEILVDATHEEIEFVTISSSTGNAQDFGDLPDNKKEIAACSNETRGLCAGGGGGNMNTIHFITIASTGNSGDFGDLIYGTVGSNITCTQSPTRGLFQNRNEPSGSKQIDYVTIGSEGNASDFGDSTDARYGAASMVCSSTRGIFAGGYSPGITNLIDFVTTATLGNATNFGDLTQAGYMMCGCSSSTRGVIGARGIYPAGVSNIIDYINIATTGDAVDFGDAITARQASAGCSNGHGGLG